MRNLLSIRTMSITYKRFKSHADEPRNADDVRVDIPKYIFAIVPMIEDGVG